MVIVKVLFWILFVLSVLVLPFVIHAVNALIFVAVWCCHNWTFVLTNSPEDCADVALDEFAKVDFKPFRYMHEQGVDSMWRQINFTLGYICNYLKGAFKHD